jgi:P27 family predicted phage terminase small subunit
LKKFKAPRGLCAEAKKWWVKIRNEYGIDDEGGLLLLATAMQAFDRMRECQRAIKRDGAAVKDKWGQVKAHPLLPVERDSRAAMLQALKGLNLDVEPLKSGPGRPSGR